MPLIAAGAAYYCYTKVNGAKSFASLAALLEYVQSLKPETEAWVDVQGEGFEGRRRLLQELPLGTTLPPSVREGAVSPGECDIVELQPFAGNYLTAVVSCRPAAEGEAAVGQPEPVAPSESGSTGADGAGGAALAPADEDLTDGPVWCTCVATRTRLLTLHCAPFEGLAETRHQVQSLAAAAAETPLTSFALATLLTFTAEMLLPDPTTLFSEVDCIDEMVLLIAPGERDQPDLLRRIALLRRRISAFRGQLYLKERLLQDCMMPAVRGSFAAAGGARIAALYNECLEKTTQVADRLDDARDVLNQANLNFVTGVSMRMSQSSANMDFRMQILGQVATICLPLNLVASIFGMNCTVPFQTDTHPTLTAFWCIIGLMVAWCMVCSVPIVRSLRAGNQAKAIVPSDE
ncbi:MGT2 magnesium transporter [Strigomonas culicis]|uniref:MGT2 magnesium transporter n=1 Tax=Strigomonas culicis TaxID=28005 RepID=S9V713_9TRYP|nr:MGT2 magnesium transporter [Strigomonas culicis]EPY32836.1 MGT2 magnesium transporter [Strigomonas culicis]|eukprot:EPY22756.1 MGT2 magnesium transporter [Strigomonas culicis]